MDLYGLPGDSVVKNLLPNAWIMGGIMAEIKQKGHLSLRNTDLMQPLILHRASLMTQMVKNLPAMQETWVQTLDQGRSPGDGTGYPFQYSCLENFMDRED